MVQNIKGKICFLANDFAALNLFYTYSVFALYVLSFGRREVPYAVGISVVGMKCVGVRGPVQYCLQF